MAKLYNYSAELDREFGKPGSPEREQFDNDALDFVRSMIGDDEYFKMLESNCAYA